MITNNHRTQAILGCLEISARIINSELFNLESGIFLDKSIKFTKTSQESLGHVLIFFSSEIS